MRGAERMVNWGSGGVGEGNYSESAGVVRRRAMAPHWPSNRVYLFPVASEVLRPGRIWSALPHWQWVVPTRHLINYGARGRCYIPVYSYCSCRIESPTDLSTLVH